MALEAQEVTAGRVTVGLGRQFEEDELCPEGKGGKVYIVLWLFLLLWMCFHLFSRNFHLCILRYFSQSGLAQRVFFFFFSF